MLVRLKPNLQGVLAYIKSLDVIVKKLERDKRIVEEHSTKTI